MGGLVAACRSIDICKIRIQLCSSLEGRIPRLGETPRGGATERRGTIRSNESHEIVRDRQRSPETVRDRQRSSEIARLVSATCALLDLLVRLFCHVFLDKEGLVGSVGVVGSLIASS